MAAIQQRMDYGYNWGEPIPFSEGTKAALRMAFRGKQCHWQCRSIAGTRQFPRKVQVMIAFQSSRRSADRFQ